MINILLSILSGVLTGLSFDFSFTSFLAWFSLIPFFYLIKRSSLKQGLIGAFLFGFFYYLTAIFWIANVTILGLIVLLFYLSLYYVLFFLLSRYFLKKPLEIITLPCLWALIEFLKENIWTGFGWANLGYSQYNHLYLIQPADIWGVKLISFLIVMVNVFIWEALQLDKQKSNLKRFVLRKASFILLVFLICFAYSAYRLSTLKQTGSIEITVAQPNIAQSAKWDPAFASLIIADLADLVKQSKEGKLVIFPEAAWPYTVDSDNIVKIRELAESSNRELVMGAVVQEQGKFYNAALLFQRFDTDILPLNRYYKVKLVPFGEYVPLRKILKFVNVLNTIGDITPGEKFSVFSQAGIKYSVLICFEDTLPYYVSQLAVGRDFLVNITNDAWFGGNPQSRQHLAIMALRAVENRISIVRSANTGISGWVSFKGEIKKLARDDREVFIPAVETFSVSLNKADSFYTGFGEFFAVICGVMLIVIFVKDDIDRYPIRSQDFENRKWSNRPSARGGLYFLRSKKLGERYES